MRIRLATPADLTQINTITLAAKAGWGYSAQQMMAWSESLVTPAESICSRPTFVAEHDSQVVGVVQVDPIASPWELVSCWVAPAHMRRGIGSALLQTLKAELARRKQEVVHIDSDPNAEAFYLSQGAVRVGEVPAPIEGDAGRVRPQLQLKCSELG